MRNRPLCYELGVNRPAMKVLFAVHDWGLGHATRDLLLIRALLGNGHTVHILSHGRALNLLQDELGTRCSYTSLPDIPKPLGRHASTFYIKMSLSMPAVFWTFRQEHQCARKLHHRHNFDCVISDSRFGVALREIPSYHLFHSLRQIIPGRPRRLEQFVESSQKRLLAPARRLLIPDQRENGLAGDLCHNLGCDWGNRLVYLGILASVKRVSVAQDIDRFISISGAEPQRTYLEQIVLRQVGHLTGKTVIALGRPEQRGSVATKGQVTIHGYMDRRQQEEMLNRARLVITRPGYTTLMELAELGRRALLIPTVGQSEQEYLADYHRNLGHLYAIRQHEVDLVRDVAIAESYPGLPRMNPSAQSVARFLDVVTGGISSS